MVCWKKVYSELYFKSYTSHILMEIKAKIMTRRFRLVKPTRANSVYRTVFHIQEGAQTILGRAKTPQAVWD